jgi:hypothetical protein
MAYHEQHERKCPTCGERISATAPKCFNWGEFVDDDEDEDDGDDEAGTPRALWGLAASLIGALICIGLVVYLVRARRPDPAAEAAAQARRLHQMMGQQAGRASLNSSSPMSLADVEPHLRVGMPFVDLERLIAQKNTGPLTSTVMGNVPLPGEEGEADETKPRPQAYIIYLKDANLVVQTDEKENVVSWKSEPIK